MAENSKIEWTDHTINFWWGCMKVSEGCANCYAETLSHRFGKSIWGPAATTSRERKSGAIANLRKWNKQAKATGEVTRVFAQSMSDFFEDHPQLVPWRAEAIDVIEECEDLIIMLLTKRPENIMRMVPNWWLHDWPGHIWIGTSVENQETANKRIPELLKVPAKVRFLSCEPLLGAVDLRLPYAEFYTGERIDWVIVGGESGHGARPMHPDWARSIRDQCQAAGVPFFFKQWGEWVEAVVRMEYPDAKAHILADGALVMRAGKAAAGRILDGRTWDEFPAVAQ